MKSIKITSAAKNEIQAALDAVNGTATAHTLHRAGDILDLAIEAEKSVVGLVGAKARAKGAVLVHTSGDKVSSGYKYGRKATRVTLERRTADWYLVDVAEAKIYSDPGKHSFWLTEAQDVAAITELHKQYSISKSAV